MTYESVTRINLPSLIDTQFSLSLWFCLSLWFSVSLWHSTPSLHSLSLSLLVIQRCTRRRNSFPSTSYVARMHASCMSMSRSCDTPLMHMWDMTHWYVGHDSMICATCLVHRGQSSWVVMVYIRHSTNTPDTAQTHHTAQTLHKHIRHIHKPHTTHLYVGRDSLTGTGSTLLIRLWG